MHFWFTMDGNFRNSFTQKKMLTVLRTEFCSSIILKMNCLENTIQTGPVVQWSRIHVLSNFKNSIKTIVVVFKTEVFFTCWTPNVVGSMNIHLCLKPSIVFCSEFSGFKPSFLYCFPVSRPNFNDACEFD